MTEAQYQAVIKKQQEIINMLLSDSNSMELPNAPASQVVSEEAPCIHEYRQNEFRDFMCSAGLSQNTISTYLTSVKMFFETYGELNNDNLRKWEDSLFDSFKPKTVLIKVNAMCKYFDFSGFDGEYVFKKVRIQQKGFSDNVINAEQYNTLIEYALAHNKISTYKIIKVISGTGVRVSELIKLKTADLQKGYSDIFSKENKQRRIFYPKHLVEEIQPLCQDEYIITNKYHQQMTTRGVSELLKYLAREAGVPSEVVYPHSFRHYFAKTFIKNSGDLSLLGDLLGHSNLSTTALYTRKTSTEQMQAVNEIIKW